MHQIFNIGDERAERLVPLKLENRFFTLTFLIIGYDYKISNVSS